MSIGCFDSNWEEGDEAAEMQDPERHSTQYG
jgi:hypothetical protein